MRASRSMAAASAAAGGAALGLAGVLACLAGCEGVRPRRTPRGTFDSLRKALVEEKYEALWDLLSASAREAESARIRAEQMRIEAELPNLTEDDRDGFRLRNGISAEEFVNLSPAKVFAMRLLRDRQVGGGLREVLGKATVRSVKEEGDRAVLEIEVAGETGACSLALVRQHGLYRLPGLQEFLDAFDVAGRARRAGDIPGDTWRAAAACVRDGAFEDLWELFSADGREWLAGIIRGDQDEVRSYDEEKARMFERAGGVPAAEFAAMEPKAAFVAEMRSGVGRLSRLAGLFAAAFVSADIEGEKASVTVSRRSGRASLPMELENGLWRFARME